MVYRLRFKNPFKKTNIFKSQKSRTIKLKTKKEAVALKKEIETRFKGAKPITIKKIK